MKAFKNPLIVYGSSNVEKDSEVLRLVCEACEGKHLIVGPVQEGNYKKIGAAAIAYKHTEIQRRKARSSRSRGSRCS